MVAISAGNLKGKLNIVLCCFFSDTDKCVCAYMCNDVHGGSLVEGIMH